MNKIIIETNLFILINIGIFLLVLLFLFFIIGYTFYAYRYKKSVQYNIDKDNFKKSLSILNEAKKRSLKIYSDAHKKSKKIIEDAVILASKNKETFEQDFKEVNDNQISEYEDFLQQEMVEFKKAVENESDKSIILMQNISNEIKKEVSDSIFKFKEDILSQTIGTQNEIDQKISDEYVQIHNEIEEYRRQKISKIDEAVIETIVEVASKSLNKSFSINEHKEVILNALFEAKSSNLLKV